MAERTRGRLAWTSRDEESLRHDALRAVPALTPDWTDLNEPDPGVVIIELTTAELAKLHWLVDKVYEESLWGTARARRSLVNSGRLIGFTPEGPAAASTDETFTLAAALGVDLVIPVGTRVGTRAGDADGVQVIFETVEELTILAGGLSGQVGVVQGTTESEDLGTSTGLSFQEFPIETLPVLEGSVLVYVDEGAGEVLWSHVDTLILSGPLDTCHTLDRLDDGTVVVQFGDGVTGKVPANGATVRAEFRAGGGSVGNVGANTIVELLSDLTAGGSPVYPSVTNAVAARGGKDEQSVEEIRREAPRLLRALGRAISPDDYQTLAERVSGVARASPGRPAPGGCCRVEVCILPAGGGVASSPLRDEILALFNGPAGDGVGGKAARPVVLCDATEVAIDVRGAAYAFPNAVTPEKEAEIAAAVADLFDLDQNPEIALGRLFDFSDLVIAVGTVEDMDRVDFAEVTRRPVPVLEVWRPAGPAFGAWEVGELSKNETWTITWTGPTTFSVQGSVSGLQTPGTLGTPYTTDGGELSFELTAGADAPVAGDRATVVTSPKVGNVPMGPNEIAKLGDLDLTLAAGNKGRRTC